MIRITISKWGSLANNSKWASSLRAENSSIIMFTTWKVLATNDGDNWLDGNEVATLQYQRFD